MISRPPFPDVVAVALATPEYGGTLPVTTGCMPTCTGVRCGKQMLTVVGSKNTKYANGRRRCRRNEYKEQGEKAREDKGRERERRNDEERQRMTMEGKTRDGKNTRERKTKRGN